MPGPGEWPCPEEGQAGTEDAPRPQLSSRAVLKQETCPPKEPPPHTEGAWASDPGTVLTAGQSPLFLGDLTLTPACTYSGRQLAGCEWETISGQAREVPGPGRLNLLLQIGDVVYTLPPTRSDVKAGVARTRGQMECPHGDPGPGIFPDHHAYLQEASQDGRAGAPPAALHTGLLICFLVPAPQSTQ